MGPVECLEPSSGSSERAQTGKKETEEILEYLRADPGAYESPRNNYVGVATMKLKVL